MTSSSATMERAQADRLPKDDVVGILLLQHARIRELFSQVKNSTHGRKQHAFDELRRLLAAHETGEEVVLRPITRQVTGSAQTDARNHEEKAASRDLAQLERLNIASAEFATRFAQLERTVLAHADREESEEFAALRRARSGSELQRLGRRLRAIQAIAPTHPHPSVTGSPTAQRALGPVLAMLDRAKDAWR